MEQLQIDNLHEQRTLALNTGARKGRFAHDTFERLVVSGAIVGGSSGAVRGASAAVRRLQGGYLRTYSAVVLVGLAALLVYFLLQG